MLDPARRLRSQARQFTNRRRSTGTRYSAAFRAEVVSHARTRARDGAALARIARDLGLRPKTLARWIRQTSVSKLRAVRVERDERPDPAAAGTAGRIVVVTPSGVWVEGLDIAGVAQLMRSLA